MSLNVRKPPVKKQGKLAWSSSWYFGGPGATYEIHSVLPKHNPLLGYFCHAPCAGNSGAIFFRKYLVSQSERKRINEYRNNPLTGYFHGGHPLHDLHYYARTRTPRSREHSRDSPVELEKQKIVELESKEEGTVKTPEEFANSYQLHEDVLGYGTYGVVRKASRRNSLDNVAVKTVRKKFLFTEEEKQAVQEEIAIMRQLNHEKIVRLYDVVDEADNILLVLEAANGGDLQTVLRQKYQLTELEARHVCRQILEALVHLHDQRILHGDIKHQNVLLHRPVQLDVTADVADASIKLCDFGFARRLPEPTADNPGGLIPFTSSIGTVGFMAPEILLRKPFGTSADLWSLGIILYEILCGFSPFYPYNQMLETPVDFSARSWAKISDSAKDLVQKLLTVDPSQRISARAALAHPWIAGNSPPVPLSSTSKTSAIASRFSAPALARFMPSSSFESFGSMTKSTSSVESMECSSTHGFSPTLIPTNNFKHPGHTVRPILANALTETARVHVLSQFGTANAEIAEIAVLGSGRADLEKMIKGAVAASLGFSATSSSSSSSPTTSTTNTMSIVTTVPVPRKRSRTSVGLCDRDNHTSDMSSDNLVAYS